MPAHRDLPRQISTGPVKRSAHDMYKKNRTDGSYKLWYREQYMSSCCHVCKIPLPNIPEFRCKSCKLVSYCSSQHMDQDADEHEEICEAVMAVANRLGVTNVFEKAYHLGGDSYREFRAGVMTMCGAALGRQLMPWEQELCLFPPLCATCHRLADDLERCVGCESTRWCCEGHRPKSHEKVCKELLLFREVCRRQQRHVPIPQMSQPPTVLDNLPGDSVEFALLTEIATCPLTVHQGLKLLPEEDNLVVHIVGPEPQFEMSNLRKWDDFLFQFLQGSLTLVFIGPEIGKLPSRRMVNDGRTLQFIFNNCLYHEYDGVKPHLICLFNPGLYRNTGFQKKDTWKETTSSLFDKHVPILITEYTKKEIRADFKRIKEDVPRLQELVSFQPNPFGSRRPLMNFVSDESTPIIFKNAYYMILKADK